MVLRPEHYGTRIYSRGLIPPPARPRKMHFSVLRRILRMIKCDETLILLMYVYT